MQKNQEAGRGDSDGGDLTPWHNWHHG